MRADEALQTALGLVTGERARTHGDKLTNHLRIAALWNAYLHNLGVQIHLDGTDVALMMALLKIARTQSGGAHNDDNYVDLAGYAAVAIETATAER